MQYWKLKRGYHNPWNSPKPSSEDALAACRAAGHPSDNVVVSLQMLDMFDVMPFDNIDGGAWKQGWDVQYDDKEFDKEPLNVFVVPHSHNDPGKSLQKRWTFK